MDGQVRVYCRPGARITRFRLASRERSRFGEDSTSIIVILILVSGLSIVVSSSKESRGWFATDRFARWGPSCDSSFRFVWDGESKAEGGHGTDNIKRGVRFEGRDVS